MRIPPCIVSRGQAAGSNLVHHLPGAPELWMRANHLDTRTSLLLRWRREQWLVASGDPNYVTIPSSETAKTNQLGTYAGAIITVEAAQLERSLADTSRQPAISYLIGHNVMTGVDELSRGRHSLRFLRPLPEADDQIGVIVGIGTGDNTTAVGTANLAGRDFRALPTLYVGPASEEYPLTRV